MSPMSQYLFSLGSRTSIVPNDQILVPDSEPQHEFRLPCAQLLSAALWYVDIEDDDTQWVTMMLSGFMSHFSSL